MLQEEFLALDETYYIPQLKQINLICKLKPIHHVVTGSYWLYLQYQGIQRE